jgi:hypothetical protein
MNEAGLFVDGLAVRTVQVPEQPGKERFSGENLVADLLATCDSVDCVIERFEATGFAGTWNGQALFGDRHGHSAIVEPFGVIPGSGGFQVATNFFQSEVPPGRRSDGRYRTASAMLASAENVSADLVRDVLDATSQHGEVNTVYSTVYDLRSGQVHLYYFGDFATVMTFDLRTELANGPHGYDMTALFPSNLAAATVAGPVRERLADAVRRLDPMAAPPGGIAALAGTYEVPPGLRLDIQADDEGLAARRRWTPWVPLLPLSATEFARVYSDPDGNVREQRLRFDLAAPGGPAQLEIVDDRSGSVVATRTSLPPAVPEWPAGILAIAVAATAAAVLWRLGGASTGRRRRSWRAGARSLHGHPR